MLKESYKHFRYVYVYINIEKANSRILRNRTGPVLKSNTCFCRNQIHIKNNKQIGNYDVHRGNESFNTKPIGV